MHPTDSKQLEPAPPVLRPPLWLQISRWVSFTATVAIAVGILVMLDRHLTGLPWVYDGPQPQFQGRTVTIDYCMLSTYPLAAGDSGGSVNCRLGFAAVSISLALSLIWTYIQSLRRNPYKHKNARIVDLVVCVLATAWWIACAIVVCYWTHQANMNGVPRADWRNGLCVLAWALALVWLYMALTSLLLITAKNQAMFDKWAAKSKEKKEKRRQAKSEKMQRKAAEEDAAAHAARQRSSAGAKVAKPDAADVGPLPTSTPPTTAMSPGAMGPRETAAAVPQSAWPSASAAGPAGAVRPAATAGAVGPAATAGEVSAGDVNPFLAQAERPLQASADNV